MARFSLSEGGIFVLHLLKPISRAHFWAHGFPGSVPARSRPGRPWRVCWLPAVSGGFLVQFVGQFLVKSCCHFLVKLCCHFLVKSCCHFLGLWRVKKWSGFRPTFGRALGNFLVVSWQKVGSPIKIRHHRSLCYSYVLTVF